MDILNCKKCKKFNTAECNCELEYSKKGTVFDHTLAVLKGLPEYSSFNLQIAALYHDVGKNEKTYSLRNGNKISYINHEKLGKYITRNRLVKLKFSISSINFIINLVEHHMDIHKLSKVSDKVVRRFLRECGDFMEDLFILVDADCKGTMFLTKDTHQLESIPCHEEIKIRAREINEEMKKLSIKPFKYFDGNELMKLFCIEKPCKLVGQLMNIQNKIIDEYGFNLSKKEAFNLIKNRYVNLSFKE